MHASSPPSQLTPNRDTSVTWAIAVWFLLAALCLSPVNETWLGALFAIVAAIVAALHPASWFVFLSGSQVVPDSQRLPFTLAQCGVITWFLLRPLKGPLVSLSGGHYVRVILPFVAWVVGVSVITRQDFQLALLSAILAGLLSFYQASEYRGNIHALLLCLLAGCGLTLLAYWAWRAGLPVTHTSYDLGLERVLGMTESTMRFGAGRSDANFVALNIPVFFFGIVGCVLFVLPRVSVVKSAVITLALLWVTIPPLAATVSRGGVYTSMICLPVLCLTSVTAAADRRRSRIAFSVSMLLAGVFVVGALGGGTTSVRSLWDSIQARNYANEAFYGSEGGLFTGRTNSWRANLRIIREYPLAGPPKGAFVDLGGYGAGLLGVDDIAGSAHNVFIGVASDSGLPALIFFTIICFAVPHRFLSRRGWMFTLPYLWAYVPIMVGFLSLSAIGWKTFWALLALMIRGAEYPRLSAN